MRWFGYRHGTWPKTKAVGVPEEGHDGLILQHDGTRSYYGVTLACALRNPDWIEIPDPTLRPEDVMVRIEEMIE